MFGDCHPNEPRGLDGRRTIVKSMRAAWIKATAKIKKVIYWKVCIRSSVLLYENTRKKERAPAINFHWLMTYMSIFRSLVVYANMPHSMWTWPCTLSMLKHHRVSSHTHWRSEIRCKKKKIPATSFSIQIHSIAFWFGVTTATAAALSLGQKYKHKQSHSRALNIRIQCANT